MPGAPTLLASANPFRPMCFARGNNSLIGINGINRGFRWDGITSSAEQLGITGPANAPSATTPTGGGATAGDYLLAFRYLDDESPNPIPSNLSPTLTATAAGSDKFDWTISTTDQETRVETVELYRSTSGQATTLYLILSHPSQGTILTAVTNGAGTPKVKFTLPTGHGLIVGSKFAVTGSSVAGYNTTHTVVTTATNYVETDIGYTSNATTATWTFAGYTLDTATDATLNTQTDTALPILNSNGSLNANRFEPPPNHKAVCAWFQDRMFYGVDVVYDEGDITLTNGSATATTTTGRWTTEMAGRYLYVTGETKAYVISSVTPGVDAEATMVLTEAWEGTSAAYTYAIRPSPDERNLIYYSEPDEPESVPAVNVVKPQENTGDDDEVVGLLPQGGYLMIVKSHHIYRMSFVKQPTIDSNITLAASRGSLTNRTCIYVEGIAFLMDTQGIYRWDGSNVDPVDAVQNLFRDGTIQFSSRDFFFCSKDPEKNIVRFHVVFSTDASEVKHAIAINYRTGAVWLEYTPFPLGAYCIADDGTGRLRPLVGSLGEQVYTQGEGLHDGVGITGQVVSATGFSITKAAGTAFPATVANASLGIVSGKGKGQITRILAPYGDDTLVVEGPLDPVPDSTSAFRVGAIAWNYKTGLLTVAQRDETDSKRSISLTYQPSATALTLDIRVYVNHETSPRNRAQGPMNQVVGIVSVPGQPDAVLDLYTYRSNASDAIGYALLPLDGFYDDRTLAGVRWMAFELRGMGMEQGFEIYEIGLEGFL